MIVSIPSRALRYDRGRNDVKNGRCTWNLSDSFCMVCLCLYYFLFCDVVFWVKYNDGCEWEETNLRTAGGTKNSSSSHHLTAGSHCRHPPDRWGWYTIELRVMRRVLAQYPEVWPTVIQPWSWSDSGRSRRKEKERPRPILELINSGRWIRRRDSHVCVIISS